MTSNRVRLLWVPYPGFQTRALAASEFEVFLGGAKGPGKSDLLLISATRQVRNERYKAYITRETGPQLDELKIRSHRLFPKLRGKPAWNGDGHGRWTWPEGGRIIFESIGTPEDAAKIQGQEPTFVGQDEVANVKDERTVDLVQAEIRSPDPSLTLMWRGTGNPGKPGQAWVKRRFITPCGIDGSRVIVKRIHLPNGMTGEITKRFIPGTVLDNPIYANDARYMAKLWTLPEALRRQLLFGDWDSGTGSALDELNEHVHFVRPFFVPSHWVLFGGFDWGFSHNWVFVHMAATEDGGLYVLDTVRGRRHLPPVIFERITSRVNIYDPRYAYTHTDTYPTQRNKSRGDATPTLQEEFQSLGFLLNQGNTNRKEGLNHLRLALAWRGIGPGGTDVEPALRFFDTPGNRWLFEQLQAMVLDEDDPEDVLKVDADGETGVGGDDGYDALRYAVGSRPPRAIGTFYAGDVSAFSAQSLAFMVEHLYKDRDLPAFNGVRSGISYQPLARR